MSAIDDFNEAIEHLHRYGRPARPEEKFAEVLWAIAELNDNIWHGRRRDICQEEVDKAKRALDEIMKENARIWQSA